MTRSTKTAAAQAVQAAPCLDTAAPRYGEAAAHIAARQCLEVIASNLRALENVRRNIDDAFDDADCDIDMTMRLVSDEVDRMRTNPPELDDFATRWYRMAAPVHLAAKSYSKPQDLYGFFLAHLSKALESLPEVWDVLALEEVEEEEGNPCRERGEEPEPREVSDLDEGSAQ